MSDMEIERVKEKEGPKEGPFRCPRCGAVTWGQLQYCKECGMYLNIECTGCDAYWRYYYDYKYCPSCGTKVES